MGHSHGPTGFAFQVSALSPARCRFVRRHPPPAPRRLLPDRIASGARRSCIALLAATLCGMAHAQPLVDAAIEMAYDSNVTRATLRDDIRSDAFATARLGGAWHWPVGDFGSAAVGAGLRGAQYLRFPALSYASLEVDASMQRKLGLGLHAPWVGATLTLAHEDYREEARDSDRLALRLEAGRRWSERLDTSAGYQVDRRHARHDEPAVPGIPGAVWDLQGQGAFARMGYALTERWQIDVGYALRRGDVVATTHRNLPIFLASDAIAHSHAFGPGFFDYRLPGTTQTGNATLSYGLVESSSLNFTWAYAYTRAAHGLDYQGNVLAASWIYRY
jgi:hypothetical protein